VAFLPILPLRIRRRKNKSIPARNLLDSPGLTCYKHDSFACEALPNEKTFRKFSQKKVLTKRSGLSIVPLLSQQVLWKSWSLKTE
jgi:hypothetical protein